MRLLARVAWPPTTPVAVVEVAGIGAHDRDNAGEEQKREDDDDLHDPRMPLRGDKRQSCNLSNRSWNLIAGWGSSCAI
jgi:hypothetical protein